MSNRGRRTWMIGVGRFDFHINKTLVSVIYQRGCEKPIKEAYERYVAEVSKKALFNNIAQLI